MCSQNPSSAMSLSLILKRWCSLMALLYIATSCCNSDPDAVDIVAKALTCFNDHYVYSSCQESYRLSAEGDIHVPHQATDEYCEGPCLIETKLVLNCVDNILYNFKFYNGATLQNVRYTLITGCGHSTKRGDFNVQEHLGDDYSTYGDFGRGNKLAFPLYSILMTCGLLLWAY